MTEEEAVRQAEAEGLMLLKADNISGYQGVHFDSTKKTKPYRAQVRRSGKKWSSAPSTSPRRRRCTMRGRRRGGRLWQRQQRRQRHRR